MGRTITPAFRLELIYTGDAAFRQSLATTLVTKQCWNSKQEGRPSNKNLEKSVMCWIVSQYPGKVNDHISKATGMILVPSGARIVRQSNSEVVAEWFAPKFMVLPEAKDYPQVADQVVFV